MTTYVALLRGINVSGRNKLAMEDLRALVSAAGGTGVRTYIQSGNVVFDSRRSPSSLVGLLERELEKALGGRVPVLVRTKEELVGVSEANPFVGRGEDPAALHVTFLGGTPEAAAVEAAGKSRSDDDEFLVVGREVYLVCRNGYGNTKLNNTFFEKKLGAQATTRNWKTVLTLIAMTKE